MFDDAGPAASGVAPAPEAARVYAGFGRGLRHHAILSIAKGVLAREPHTAGFFLFYGNRSTSA